MIEKSADEALQEYIMRRTIQQKELPCSVEFLETRLEGTGVSINAFNTRMKDAGFTVEEDLVKLVVTYSK